MSNVIIFTNENGGVSMCMPTGELPIEDVQKRDIPSGVQSFIVSHASLPHDDADFYDAWEQTRGVVTINISKAREITKNRLRLQREPLLAAQDVAFQRALESGADTTAIVAEKNRLRNVTSLADSATTLAELRAITVA
jgi:hypothetical protein